jgi:hypothetical protein
MDLLRYHNVTACRMHIRHIQKKHLISIIVNMLQRVGCIFDTMCRDQGNLVYFIMLNTVTACRLINRYNG